MRFLLGRLLFVVVVAALLVGVALTQLRVREQQEDRADRDAVVAAASQWGTDFLSLSHTQARQDTDRVLAGATGAWADEFRATQEQLISVIGASRSTSVGQVLKAGVESVRGNRAVVLLAADATVTNLDLETAQEASCLRSFRMSLSMERRDGRWLMAELELAGNPSSAACGGAV